ncbi:MAG: hypothetical protein CMB80_16770 [Flammeovirgaceae bacterium]|nr:hypothetical protein [Flammeovirgaceae bacterium]MBE63024.1 hypothetical protein [Flammeovirgaceae bacterium]|tara:strand:- start:1095 stop:3260 length:2166 start_codon:yes stop_codon:yes gene_type:complete
MPQPDLKKLNSSWTKFDVVQVIELAAEGRLEQAYESKAGIDLPVLRGFLGIHSFDEPFPDYWREIKKFPKQLRLFALLATIFTHDQNIRNFADSFAKGNMRGVQIVKGGKQGTNLRRALIISGAALKNYQNEKEVPYDLSALFEEGKVGRLFCHVLKQRLIKIGHESEELEDFNDFLKICFSYQFYKVLSLTRDQFKRWLSGESLNLEDEIFNFSQLKIYKNIPMIKMNQWLNEWDDVNYSSDELRRKPEPVAYIFSMDARLLKKLSDVHRRKPDKPRDEDTHVQRNLNESRISEINSYIEGGFPWSTLSTNEQRSFENQKLKMPGFLPTAIIANIIGPNEKRNNKSIKEEDLIKVDAPDDQYQATLRIPEHIFDKNWEPDLKPIEIIDGQHRLWAFNEDEPLSGNFEVPVVAYFNLDRAWQAYLFYTINIKPVKINTSLGYDLYPLLRTQEWLEHSKEGLLAYRETRAQEIVEALWNYPDSPWFKRINMIGESGGPTMSQAAFIRSLSNSFFKKRNGLFSSPLSSNDVLPWTRTQQAAFLIILWQEIAKSVSVTDSEWANALRNEDRQLKVHEDVPKWDLAFTSKNSFLSRDQGVRGISLFANDFFYVAAGYNDLPFDEFDFDEEDEKSITINALNGTIEYFKSERTDLYNLIENFGKCACNVDWRTPSSVFDQTSKRDYQMRYKGSSGYSEFWKSLLDVFLESDNEFVKKYVGQMTDMR